MKTDTAKFLEAILWALPEDEPEEIRQATVYDFTPEFINAAETFVDGFRAYAESLDLDPDAPGRDFGANVYFSLSGHGVGFWDDDGKDGEGHRLQAALEDYAARKYQFEEITLDFIDLGPMDGKLDLSFIPSAIEEYRAKLFATKNQTPRPCS